MSNRIFIDYIIEFWYWLFIALFLLLNICKSIFLVLKVKKELRYTDNFDFIALQKEHETNEQYQKKLARSYFLDFKLKPINRFNEFVEKFKVDPEKEYKIRLNEVKKIFNVN